jgi:hypothetical protein
MTRQLDVYPWPHDCNNTHKQTQPNATHEDNQSSTKEDMGRYVTSRSKYQPCKIDPQSRALEWVTGRSKTGPKGGPKTVSKGGGLNSNL